MNPLVDGAIALERMAALQEEADRWRLTHHPEAGRRARRFPRIYLAGIR